MTTRRRSVTFTAMLGAAAVWSLLQPLFTQGADPGVSLAYVGPGAGFAFLGSFLALAGSIFLSLASLLTFPLRIGWRVLRRKKGFRGAQARKVIFLGLDGLDPQLTERFMQQGKLPNLAKLRQDGTYCRLRTTCPALSPVAWSTFATGVNPAKHNIFDFLNRSLQTYVPELAGSRVEPPRRAISLGRWRIPISRPVLELRRKSKSFWSILGEHAIRSTILRVPITFPPERFDGHLLSAMSTPDLRGTQGSFSLFSTRTEKAHYEQGSRYPLKQVGGWVEGEIEGPEDAFLRDATPLKIPFRIRTTGTAHTALLEIQEEKHELRMGEYTPWIPLRFRASLGLGIRGIARVLLTESGPDVSLYFTPVQIDPEHPALPISHPSAYAVYLAKLLGTYATVGMAEDTWALNEGVIDEGAFLKQAWQIFEERERMFLHTLERTRRGVAACVFDTSDRVQHMFYRYLDGRNQGPFANTIEDLYCRMDDLVGKTLKYVDKDTVLFVLSDHGFCAFRRGVNLNAWLLENGYLALKDGASESGPYFHGVDWSRTRAYVMGLSGLYVNQAGREAQGIVKPGAEAHALRQELIEKLTGLRDPESGNTAIRTVYDSRSALKGPYIEAAPDLIIGYAEGYRVSWDAATGKVTRAVFEDNTKAWSGDHSVDPALVPGVMFSNRRFEADDPGIEDMAPTALTLFGVQPPAWMDGKTLIASEAEMAAPAVR